MAGLRADRGVLDVDWGQPLDVQHPLAAGLILFLLGVPHLASPADTNATHGTWRDLSPVRQDGAFVSLGSGLAPPLIVRGPDLPPGLVGVNFRGAASNRYGIRPARADLHGAARCTLAVWCRAGLASASGTDYFFTWPTASGSNGVDIQQNGSNYRVSCITTGADVIGGLATPVPDTTRFHRLVLTFETLETNALRFYLDGVQHAQTVLAFGTVSAPYQACFLGNFSDGFDAPWTGAIAGALTWRDRTLSAAEVAALDAEMQAGFPTLLRRVPSRRVWPALVALGGGGAGSVALSGTAAASSGASAALSLAALALTGSAAAQSAARAYLPGPLPLSATASATSSASAALSVLLPLGATAQALSGAQGALTLAPLQLTAASAATSAAFADLTGLLPPRARRLPAHYAAALARTGYAPIYLVELVHAGQYLATRPFQSGGPWRCGDGLVSGAPQAVAGGQRPAYQATLAAVGPISTETDDQGRARLGNVTVEILNQDLAAGALSAQLVLEHTVVRILQGFQGGGYDDFLPLMTGVIDRAEATWDALRLDVVDGTFRKHRDLSTPLGGQYFPGTPRENRGRAIPLHFGRNVNVRPIQVAGDASASLAAPMTATQDFCDLTEFDAPFPPAGEVSIGGETAVTYTSRQLISHDGLTYLRLGGLSRPAGVSHGSDEAVMRTSVVYTYLIGYAVSTLLAVRQAGVLVSPAAYTFASPVGGADRPVSLLEFDAPQDDLTVDVQDDPASGLGLTNGGFETGDGTGWSVAGATLAVTSGDTPFGLGTYKAALTGDTENTDGRLSQVFGALPGEEHVLSFWYRDPVTTGDLLTNGDFATGDLTGWTITEQRNCLVDVVLPWVYRGPWGLRLRLPSNPSTFTSFSARLIQDVPVTVGQLYQVECWCWTGAWWKTTLESPYPWNASHTLELGTPTSKTAYALVRGPWRRLSDTVHNYSDRPWALYTEGFREEVVSGRWQPAGDGTWPTFTATAATLRVTLIGDMSGTPPPFPAHAFPPMFFTSVRLTAVSASPPRIRTSYRLGTAADAAAYRAETLPAAPVWRAVEGVRFTPARAQAQLTFVTQWRGLQQPSQLDRAAVHLGDLDPTGRNPIVVMRALIRTHLPALPVDEAAFAAARAARAGWRVGALLTDPGDSRALLERLGQHCATRVFENTRGELSLSVYDVTRAPVLTLGPAQIVDDAALAGAERASLDTIYTTFHVWWGKRAQATGTPAQNYQGLAFAHPTATSHATPVLSTQCAIAARRYRRTQTLEVYADFVRDAETADRLLAHLVEVHTRLRTTVTLTAWLDAAPVQLYDVVEVQHPVVAGGRLLACEVRGKRVNPSANTVDLTLVELRPGDVDEEWDYDVVLFDDVPLDEEWEQ